MPRHARATWTQLRNAALEIHLSFWKGSRTSSAARTRTAQPAKRRDLASRDAVASDAARPSARRRVERGAHAGGAARKGQQRIPGALLSTAWVYLV